jgi:Uma2 family endonuclease
MSPKGTRHDAVVQRLAELLTLGLVPRASVRIQSAFAASSGSEPEPDVAVVPRADYDANHPEQAYLLVEVSDSSLTYDREVKSKLYAECGVPEYWIVNLVDDIVEVRSDIVNGAYVSVKSYRRGESSAPQAFGDVRLDVTELLG